MTDISLYASIAAELKRTHPSENEDRLAQAAALIFKNGLAVRDPFGRLQYHPDAFAIAPKLGPAPSITENASAETRCLIAERLEAWIEGKVTLPRKAFTPTVDPNIAAAEALEAEMRFRLANNGESMIEKMTRELAEHEAGDLSNEQRHAAAVRSSGQRSADERTAMGERALRSAVDHRGGRNPDHVFPKWGDK